jgi:hypothetical protein
MQQFAASQVEDLKGAALGPAEYAYRHFAVIGIEHWETGILMAQS